MSRDELMPRKTGDNRIGFVYSAAIHAGLVIAFAFGVHWHAAQPEGVEAELWAAVPQIAAPRPVEPPPVVAPPTPKVVEPTPPPAARPEPDHDAQIAIERAKREEKLQKQ